MVRPDHASGKKNVGSRRLVVKCARYIFYSLRRYIMKLYKRIIWSVLLIALMSGCLILSADAEYYEDHSIEGASIDRKDKGERQESIVNAKELIHQDLVWLLSRCEIIGLELRQQGLWFLLQCGEWNSGEEYFDIYLNTILMESSKVLVLI